MDTHAFELSKPCAVPRMFTTMMMARPTALLIRTPRTASRFQSLANHKIMPHARSAAPPNRRFQSFMRFQHAAEEQGQGFWNQQEAECIKDRNNRSDCQIKPTIHSFLPSGVLCGSRSRIRSCCIVDRTILTDDAMSVPAASAGGAPVCVADTKGNAYEIGENWECLTERSLLWAKDRSRCVGFHKQIFVG